MTLPTEKPAPLTLISEAAHGLVAQRGLTDSVRGPIQVRYCPDCAAPALRQVIEVPGVGKFC